MRKEYIEIGWRAVTEGRLRWLADQMWKYANMKRAFRRGHPVTGPILGSILVTYRCNNTCLMCDYPQEASRRYKAGHGELSEDEMLNLVDQFAEIGTSGLAFSGGEPFLRKDMMRLIERSRHHRMVTNVNTNGNLLAKESYARPLIESGIELINISIDGADASTHDFLRNTPGGFDKILEAMELLNELIAQTKSRSLINWVTVISPRNVSQIEAILKLAKKHRVNRVGFMPVHHFDFQEETERQGLYDQKDEHYEKEVEQCVATLLELGKRYPLDSSPEYIKLFKHVLMNQPSPLTCYAGYNSLMVNSYGEIFPCFPWIEMKKSVGSVRETPLPEFWHSKQYNQMRQDISQCRDCLWNCQTELNLLFN